MRLSTLGIHNASIGQMLARQAEVLRSQQQIASQQKFRTAGENPAGMAQALSLQSAQAAQAQLADNAGSLRHRLSSEEAALSAVDDSLGRIRELALQAGNGALSSEDRAAIRAELDQQYARLLDLANSDDGTGRYLFAGSQDSAPPFARSHDGVDYHGDQLGRALPVGAGTQMLDGDTGDAVFLRIGGVPAVSVSAGNSGSLVVSQLSGRGSEPMSIQFSGGQYLVSDGDGNPVQSGPYSAGQALELPGLRLALGGSPAEGDRLEIGAPRHSDLFSRVRAVMSAVSLPLDSEAGRVQAQTARNTALSGLDEGMSHINSLRSSVGSRLARLDEVDNQLSALDEQLQTTLSGVRDIDYAEAISRLQMQTTALEAAQAVFAKVQGLSLFNYLR